MTEYYFMTDYYALPCYASMYPATYHTNGNCTRRHLSDWSNESCYHGYVVYGLNGEDATILALKNIDVIKIHITNISPDLLGLFR